jgi:purine-nucleoside phosphorylase
MTTGAPPADVQEAADSVAGRLSGDTPAVAIVLGSGLGGLAARIQNGVRVPYADIPGFPETSVAGHSGELVAGRLAERPVIALAGRYHLYEGHSARRAAFPIRVAHALGARTLFVSNAAGGIRRTLTSGTLMIIADHMNLAWRNPLIGAAERGDDRFPDMSQPYDPALRQLLKEAAADVGTPVDEGTYAWLLGPTYETPAEVRMLERLGADAVGMSTVPEVLVARAIGMRVAGVSCITNLAAGISPTPISHHDVLETTKRAAARFEALVQAWVARLDPRA